MTDIAEWLRSVTIDVRLPGVVVVFNDAALIRIYMR